ncbi:type I-F CRISPR-associated protein Csy3 [Acinetobacter soli]|uniref:type I-F CRISPR-associated protein Csy3 n=1 Tax=Acinetobacter soli TaxID=487316 RepID=UPI001BA5C5BD|nr:type I-F CRISPR-associated protein Csy3 [Acinetobacter soli]
MNAQINSISAEDFTTASTRRSISTSRGKMKGTKWTDRKANQPIVVTKEGTKGVISQRIEEKEGKKVKKDFDLRQANIQHNHEALIPVGCDTLQLDFNLKIIGGLHRIDTTNTRYQDRIFQMIEEYKEKFGLNMLAYRYAYNLAIGRFLWRNAEEAAQLEIIVKDAESEQTWAFDAMKVCGTNPDQFINHDAENNDLDGLANEIAAAILDHNKVKRFEVTAYALMGELQPVYPSQIMPGDDDSSEMSRQLLKDKNDHAQMTGTKLSNALRTIDTWYPGCDQEFPVAIPVESYGTVLSRGQVKRAPKHGDFFTLFDKYVLDSDSISDEDKHYVIAMIIRGGVFNKKTKND